MAFNSDALVADKDTKCCVCHCLYLPGDTVTIYYPCKHYVHATCYSSLKKSGFKKRCPMDNLKKRTVMQFTISLELKDRREIHNEDRQSSLDKDRQSSIVSPSHSKCAYCNTHMDDAFAYKLCKACGIPYHTCCAFDLCMFKKCCGEECRVPISTIQDFNGRLRIVVGPINADSSTSSESRSGSGSGSDSDIAATVEEEEDLQFVIDL